jgi:hypothetical protein
MYADPPHRNIPERREIMLPALGQDQNGKSVFMGDIERRSGLYILGKPGMGKSALMVNLANNDILSPIPSPKLVLR